jgi:hypothetical protein
MSILVWEGLTNRESGENVGTSVVKNCLRSAFDKLGVWSRLELTMYVANHRGKDCLPETDDRHSLGALDRSALILDMALSRATRIGECQSRR